MKKRMNKKKIKLPIKTIQTIIKKKVQKCEIFLYNSSLRAEATCEFYWYLLLLIIVSKYSVLLRAVIPIQSYYLFQVLIYLHCFSIFLFHGAAYYHEIM